MNEIKSTKILLAASEAATVLSIGKSTFWREVKKGNIPKPVQIGSIKRWSREALEQLVSASLVLKSMKDIQMLQGLALVSQLVALVTVMAYSFDAINDF